MYSDNRFVFYEKQYYHELEMKQKIDLRLQALIAFTFAWLNITSYLIQDIDLQGSPIAAMVFYNLITAFVLLILLSLRFSVFSFYGNIYQYMETPHKLEEFHNDTKAYYEEYYPEESVSLTNVRFKEILMNDLIQTTHNNCQINDSRSIHSFESIKILVIAAIPFALAFIIHVSCKLDLKHPSKPILIEEKTLKGALNNAKNETITITATTTATAGNS